MNYLDLLADTFLQGNERYLSDLTQFQRDLLAERLVPLIQVNYPNCYIEFPKFTTPILYHNSTYAVDFTASHHPDLITHMVQLKSLDKYLKKDITITKRLLNIEQLSTKIPNLVPNSSVPYKLVSVAARELHISTLTFMYDMHDTLLQSLQLISLNAVSLCSLLYNCGVSYFDINRIEFCRISGNLYAIIQSNFYNLTQGIPVHDATTVEAIYTKLRAMHTLL